MRSLGIALVVQLLLLLLPRSALAHGVGLSRGEYVAEGDVVSASLHFGRKELAEAIEGLDADDDGSVSAQELDRGHQVLTEALLQRMDVRGDGQPCTGKLESASLIENDGLDVRSSFRCPAPPQRLRIELAFLGQLAPGHRHLARAVVGGSKLQPVLTSEKRVLELSVASAGEAPGSDDRGFLSLLALGVEHILTGYDHLVFLLGLVLVRGTFRSILIAVTAFTVAHSITLGLAALNVWVPGSSVIEPLIALSIGYIGVENFFVKDAEKRWRITLPFGLVHGFGFAGALRELELSPAEVPGALLSFNLGVELGQIAALLLIVPLLVLIRKRASWFETTGVRAASGAIAALGVGLFVLRIVPG